MSDDEKPGLHAVPQSGYLKYLHTDYTLPQKQVGAFNRYFRLIKSASVPDAMMIVVGDIHHHDSVDIKSIDLNELAHKLVTIEDVDNTDDLAKE